MSISPVQLALMVGPLVLYLYIVALLQSGRGPRLVRGPLDYGLLLFGLSGPLAFGPVGRLLLRSAGSWRGPDGWALLTLLSALGLLALPWLPRAFRRLVVYNVDSEALDRTLREVLDELPGHFVRTLRGFEDRAGARGIAVETVAWSRTATIEAYGREPEGLIGLVGSGLRDRLRAPVERPSAVAWILLGACLALVLPVLGLLLDRPQTREALRVLLERLQGG